MFRLEQFKRLKTYFYSYIFGKQNLLYNMSRTNQLRTLSSVLPRRIPTSSSIRHATNVPSTSHSYASLASEQPSLATSPAPFEVFDRSAKRKQRDRAAMRVDEQTGKTGGKSRVTDYLKNEVAERMFERFEVGPRELHQGLSIKQIKAGYSDSRFARSHTDILI